MARRHFSSQALVLIVISIAINMIGGQLASMVKLPIFLDSIGTLISAVLLGPIIGMLTGLLTNLLWGLLTDPIAAAFAPVAMVIGPHCRKTWQLQFTYTASQPGTHQKIIDMAMNGVGCRATARIMGVGLNTILRHLKNSGRSR